jgi:hypothetical protein
MLWLMNAQHIFSLLFLHRNTMVVYTKSVQWFGSLFFLLHRQIGNRHYVRSFINAAKDS